MSVTSPLQSLPAKGVVVMDNLAFLASAADFWIFVSLLCWFLSFYLALEGQHLAYRRSLNQRVWLGAGIICGLKIIKNLQELLFFSYESFHIPVLNWFIHVTAALAAIVVFFLTFPKVETAPQDRRRLIGGALAMLALDFIFTMLATDFWSRAGLLGARYPVPQAIIGIGGQVLLSLEVFVFLAWQTQRLRLAPRASRLLTEGLTLIAIVTLAFFACRFLYAQALREKNSRDMEVAQNAVLATPIPEALRLRGVLADEDTAAFRKVYENLTLFRDANPSIEKVYLWTMRGDDLIVLADTSRLRKDYMPPGTIQEKAETRDREFFGLHVPWIYGPFRNKWTSYTCVNNRIVYPGTDRTFCWVRTDLNSGEWLSTFSTRRLLIMASAALLCLLVLVSNNYRLRALDDVMVERAKQHATETERVRVGRELHDDLGQLLSAINIQSNILADEIDPAAVAASRSRELCALTQRAVVATQEMARGLVPEDGDFNVTYRQFCLQIARSLSVECVVDDQTEEIELRREVRAALMRVSQESINNAVKHGKATRINAQLEILGGALELQIADNGSGFQRWERQAGIGTSVMRARIEELGGSFSLESAPGSGVIVRCLIPQRLIGIS